MGDKYANGFVSGFCGGIAAAATNLSLILGFNYGELKFGDFAGVLVFGHFPRGFWESVIAYIAYAGFAGTLGVIFSYLVPVLSSKYLLFKGLHFGIGVWFISYAITLLFKVPDLEDIPLKTAVTNLLASSLYGLIMTIMLRWLIKRQPAKERDE